MSGTCLAFPIEGGMLEGKEVSQRHGAVLGVQVEKTFFFDFTKSSGLLRRG